MPPQLANPLFLTAAMFTTCFFATLGTSIYIVAKTGTTRGLRDLADLIRAFFRSPT